MFNGKQIYFDNAASSYPKPISVYRGVASFIRNNGANPGRSGHRMSEEASAAVYETREKAGEYFGVSVEDVIFTKNATEALNTAIFGAYKNGMKNFMASDVEHNSVLRPLAYLEKNLGIKLGFFQYNNFFSATEQFMPDVVICASASNVTGNLTPVDEIGAFCKRHGILFIIDASQTAGYPFSYGCDILCTAGHKGLYGIQGSGLLIAKSEMGKAFLSPVLYGGNGNNSLELLPEIISPESFESGTLNTPAIVGLGKGLDFVMKNEKALYKKEKELQKFICEELSLIDGVTLYTDVNNSVPITAFNINGISSETVTSYFSDFGIFVRGGYHCAPLCHRMLGTVPGGAVRISIGAFNSRNDAQALISVVKKLKR